MLRHLELRRRALAHLLVCCGVACSSAEPIDVGVDYAMPPGDGATGSEDPPEVQPSGVMTPVSDYDSFLDSGWERGEVSPYCRSSFKACGGLLAGTWVVEDNCNPEIRSRDVLLKWGTAQMSLDETACWDAVQLLTWNWTGELKFDKGKSIDKRRRAQRVELELTASCLSATFGIAERESVDPDVCESLETAWMTCALAGGVCMCTNRTVSTGIASGVYGVLGTSVAIGVPSTNYEYCVDGDRLLWREKEGAQRQVVLRRTETAPPGTVDPVEIPR